MGNDCKDIDREEMHSRRIERIKEMGIHYENLLSLRDKVRDKVDAINGIAQEFNSELEEEYEKIEGVSDGDYLIIPIFEDIDEIEAFMLRGY